MEKEGGGKVQRLGNVSGDVTYVYDCLPEHTHTMNTLLSTKSDHRPPRPALSIHTGSGFHGLIATSYPLPHKNL